MLQLLFLFYIASMYYHKMNRNLNLQVCSHLQLIHCALAFCLFDHLVGWLKLKLIMILCFSSQTFDKSGFNVGVLPGVFHKHFLLFLLHVYPSKLGGPPKSLHEL